MTAYDDRPLWPGTVAPVGGTVDRRAGSVRRTTNLDMIRFEGLRGPLVVAGSGRDLLTLDDTAEPRVVDRGSVSIEIDYLGPRTVTTVAADPAPEGLDGLIGAPAGSGFRRALAEHVPGLVAGGGVLHQLLDDVTPAVLISGSVLAREGLIRLAAAPGKTAGPMGICAGWQFGGAMEAHIAETGVPLLGLGPTAPVLDRADDPWAWHETGDLPPTSMRRRRLIDVGPDPDADVADALAVQVQFRDSYWEHDLVETVVHEYRLVLRVVGGVVTAASATPGPLPAPECPSAAASVDRLVGHGTADLRARVRDEFQGITTCTHLNDVFRSLADLDHLAAHLTR